jgi:flagellin-like protein
MLEQFWCRALAVLDHYRGTDEKARRRRQRGITDLETAIILIAFVVVASVLAYTALMGAIYSSEKSKQTFEEGIDSIATLRPQGELVGYSAEIQIHDCESLTGWTANTTAASANTSLALDTACYKQGDASVEITIDTTSTGTAQRLANASITSLDLTTAASLRFQIKVSEAISSGELSFVLYDTMSTYDKEDDLTIPAVAANTWTEVDLDLAAPEDCGSIEGIGLEMDSATISNSTTILLDDVEIVRYVYRFEVMVTAELAGCEIDLTPPYLRRDGSHGEIQKSNKEAATLISYIDADNQITECAWTVEFLGDCSDDYILEDNETAAINVWLVNYLWDSTNSQIYYSLGSSSADEFMQTASTLLKTKTEFKLEITPPGGATYPLARTTPASLSSVMYLLY